MAGAGGFSLQGKSVDFVTKTCQITEAKILGPCSSACAGRGCGHLPPTSPEADGKGWPKISPNCHSTAQNLLLLLDDA